MDSGLGISCHSKSVLQMTTSKLDYESPFIVENGVTKTHEITIQTQSNTSSNGPIEFHLVADPEKFTDASSVKLHGKVGIHYKNSDGVWENVRNLPNIPKFGVINNFFSSLISSCVVKVNDCEIGENSSTRMNLIGWKDLILMKIRKRFFSEEKDLLKGIGQISIFPFITI